jgi:phage recombination protein Bet
MSTALTIPEGTKEALEIRSVDQVVWSAIKSSVFPGANDESIIMAMDYCKARGLDVMKKPCHIVPMNVKNAKTGKYGWRDVIMPGIAEARITASRTGEYGGQEAPIYGDPVKLKFGDVEHTVPEYCIVTVYRLKGEQKVATSHTEFFEEACATTKHGGLNSMWTRRKRGQLSKCAEAGALRKAFPEEVGGLPTVEEMSGEPRNVTDSVSESAPAIRKDPINPFPKKELPDQKADPRLAELAEEDRPVAETKAEPTATEAEPAGLKKAMISDVEVINSKPDAKKAWTAYKVELFIDGNAMTVGTFSKTKGELLVSLKGQEALVALKETSKGMEFDHVEAIAATEGGLV